MAVADLDPGKMGLPDNTGVPCFLKLLGEIGKGSVPAPGVDPDHPYPLFGQKEGAFPVHTCACHQVLFRAPGCVGTGLNQDNVQGLQFVTDVVERLLEVPDRNAFSVDLVPEVEEHPMAEAPRQGDLVDSERGLSPVHGGMIVIGRIQVGP